MHEELVPLKLEYSRCQMEVFFEDDHTRRCVHKGRRLGFTRGSAQFIIEKMLSAVCEGKPFAALWGDVTAGNITSYVERYFMPILNQLPKDFWNWNQTRHVLKFGGGTAYCDFRSADVPKNWEGFGYDLIILNEAGLILNDVYLWNNALRPMIMDKREGVIIIGGTPKGKNLFYDLCNRESIQPEKWKTFQYSSYDNPYLDTSAIEEYEEELGGSPATIRQEIYGDFVEQTMFGMFDVKVVSEAQAKYSERSIYSSFENDPTSAVVWGVDVARQGGDNTVLAKRHADCIYEVRAINRQDLMLTAEAIVDDFALSPVDMQPDSIFIESNGLGAGLYDRCRQLGLPVVDADVSRAALSDKFLNKKAEMYKDFSEAMKRRGFVMCPSQQLLKELGAIEYYETDKGKIKLVGKNILRKTLKASSDYADACALTYYNKVFKRQHRAVDEDYAFSGPYMGSW